MDDGRPEIRGDVSGDVELNLQLANELYAGGPGSGCNPEAGKCGRPERPKGVVFHGTPIAHVSGILKHGLKARNAIAGKGVYTSSDFKQVLPNALGEMGSGNWPTQAAVVVIKNWKGLKRHAEWGFDSEKDPVFDKDVPVKNIHHVEIYDVKDLYRAMKTGKVGSLKPVEIRKP